MRNAISKMSQRRQKQMEYNRDFGIIPQTIKKVIHEGLREKTIDTVTPFSDLVEAARKGHLPPREVASLVVQLSTEMELAANRLDFETAILLRDQLKILKKKLAASPDGLRHL